MQLFEKLPQFDFMSKRKPMMYASVVLVIIFIVSFVVRGFNFGLDFTGGTLLEVGYPKPIEVSEVRKTLEQAGMNDILVQHFGTSQDVLIRVAARKGMTSSAFSNQIIDALRKPYNEQLAESAVSGLQKCYVQGATEPSDCNVQIRRVEFVGPQVGEELVEDGGLAMLFALLGILVYVYFRFEYRLALGSVIATIHDVVITLGIFSLFQLEFDLTVLAAVLAVIGYSLNDTIVVYDRIRENFRKMRKASPVEAVNTALNQTLSRTIMTSFTTLLVVIALFIFGGSLIHNFSLALIIGIAVGTYSSIYVASAAAIALGISKSDLMPIKKEGAELDKLP